MVSDKPGGTVDSRVQAAPGSWLGGPRLLLAVAASNEWPSPEDGVANPPGMRVAGLLLECESVLASCDVKNLAQAATAAAKLAEIERALAAIKGDGRAVRGRAHVKEQARKLRLASLDSV